MEPRWRGRLSTLARQLPRLNREPIGDFDGGVDPTTSTLAATPASSPSPRPRPPTVDEVVVLGACVMDVVARPSPGLSVSRGGSVPGVVSLTPGGVGRNVAVALSALLPLARPRVRIVSLVGGDAAGDALVASLEEAGVDASGVERIVPSPSGDGGTPVVVSVHEGEGDVAASVADVSSVERAMTPEFFERRGGAALGSTSRKIVVVDGNLSAAAIRSLCSSSPVSLFEPVSVAKGARAVGSGALRCRVATPNAAELVAMADAAEGRGARDAPTPSASASASPPPGDVDRLLRDSLAPAARTLLDRGIVAEAVLVTLGASGAALIGRQGLREATAAGLLSGSGGERPRRLVACVVPAAPVPGGGRVVSTGGAGDALAAGFVAAAASSPPSSVAFALSAGAAAAAQVVASPLSSPRIDAGMVWEHARREESKARWVDL